jgi:glucokinase
VPKVTLPEGHLVRVLSDGAVRDLGPVSDEDLRLLEYVTQEAAGRLTVRRGKPGPSVATLTRVRAFARRLREAGLG